MNVKKRIKRLLKDSLDNYIILRVRHAESRKFKDPRRTEIFNKVKLTAHQKEEIDALYKMNYGRKIPYTWHRHYTAFTGRFDVNYFPELLYIPEFEYFQNLDKAYLKTFSDKNVLPILASWGGINMPACFLSVTCGIYRDSRGNEIAKDEAMNIAKNIGECFIKPTIDSNSGNGCFVARFVDGVDVCSGQSIESVLSGCGSNFVIQERVKCHESIAKIYPGSVNTFRIITYRWKNEICHMPVIMRIGRGGNYLDNAHAGGMFIAINDDGTLHKTAFTEFKEEYVKHPDTGVVFEGYKISFFPKILAACKKMCGMMPQIGCINWDFTLDEQGEPLLIEANLGSGSVWLSEMAHGCGPFGDKTAEVLRWICLMKYTKPENRWQYQYGKNF